MSQGGRAVSGVYGKLKSWGRVRTPLGRDTVCDIDPSRMVRLLSFCDSAVCVR